MHHNYPIYILSIASAACLDRTRRAPGNSRHYWHCEQVANTTALAKMPEVSCKELNHVSVLVITVFYFMILSQTEKRTTPVTFNRKYVQTPTTSKIIVRSAALQSWKGVPDPLVYSRPRSSCQLWRAVIKIMTLEVLPSSRTLWPSD